MWGDPSLPIVHEAIRQSVFILADEVDTGKILGRLLVEDGRRDFEQRIVWRNDFAGLFQKAAN